MGKGKLIALGVAFALVALGVYSFSISQQPGDYDEFAKCLTENDVKMWGAYWCPACAQQKDIFGRSFKFVTYIECAESRSSQTQFCTDNNIESYPTWEFPDGSRQTGVLPLTALAQQSGCALQ